MTKPDAAVLSSIGARFPLVTDDCLLLPPSDRSQWSAWREQLGQWRAAVTRAQAGSDALYRRPELAWAGSAFVGAFAMLWDTRLYDRRKNRWTLDAFLADGEARFGGYDFLVLWHAYPRIGVDDRNQFDFYRDMPGGLAGLRDLGRELHRRGLRVFIDYNPWDTATRREGISDERALADMVGALEADGVFLDTLDRGSGELRRLVDAVRPGVAFEAEVPVPLDQLAPHQMSWIEHTNERQWTDPPGVLRNKWIERLHMQHRVARFNRDHTLELHSAWMNGCGMLVWENVFGSEFLWSRRDQSILRAMRAVQRRYANLFSLDPEAADTEVGPPDGSDQATPMIRGGHWTPLVETAAPDVYANLWEGEGIRLWTLVNRADEARSGRMLSATISRGTRCFDLIGGMEGRVSAAGAVQALEGTIRPRGIGGYVALPADRVDDDFLRFLAAQKAMAERMDWDASSPLSPERLKRARRTARKVQAEVPADMAVVPRATFDMTVSWRSRECGFCRTPLMTARVAGGFHQLNVATRKVRVGPYALDLTPVTNAQYAEFLRAAGYRPVCEVNFLKHWVQGAPPAGQEDHPVVYVDLDDARAFAAWAGKRLPTEEEWQYAAQGPDLRLWPWLEQSAADRRWWPEPAASLMAEPGFDRVNRGAGTTSVLAHPLGRAACGCWDMCGNTWEWTESEREDGRSRFCVLKGGSFFRADDRCGWYTDGGPRLPSFALKFMLTWPGLDRCATVGFRCASDLLPA